MSTFSDADILRGRDVNHGEREREREGKVNRVNDAKEDLLDGSTREYRSHSRSSNQDLRGDTFLYASRVAEIFPLRKRPDDEMHLNVRPMQPPCISEDSAINRTRRLLWVNYKAAILRRLAIPRHSFFLR